jgi:hypothetical protein
MERDHLGDKGLDGSVKVVVWKKETTWKTYKCRWNGHVEINLK